MGYTGHAIKGLSWIGGVRVVTRILSLLKTAIIARILSPLQFGVFGIATLLLTFIEIVTETGINVFLVQRKEDVDDYISTAWIVSIFRGILTALVIALSAKFVASFYHSPEAYRILLLTSIIPFVRGFINPSEVKFQKELQFNKEFYFRTSLFFIETALSVVFVVVLHTVEGLILALIGSALAEVILSFTMVKPIPQFLFHKERFKEVAHFGKWITLSTIFNYFYQHGDDITVGRLLGTSSLGLYDMAYRISLAPLSDVADVVAKVTFPLYVKMSDDPQRLQRAYVRTLLAVCGLVLPIGFILFFFPELVISILLGDKWLPMTHVLRILGLFGIIRAISSFSSTVFLSIGKQQIFTFISFVGMAGLGITIIPFVHIWGIVGAGYAALIGTTATLPVIFYFVRKYIYASNSS